MRLIFLRKFFGALFLAVLSPAVIAADVGTLGLTPGEAGVVGQISAGRANETNIQRTTPTGAIAPIGSPVAVTPSQKTGLPPEAAKITFNLTRVIIEGNTVYRRGELEAIVKPYLRTISLAELEQLQQAITNKYRNDGYVISQAILPPQSIKGGVVRIQILEGFINEVTVTGLTNSTGALIKAFAHPVEKMRPLNIHALERALLLANDIPGVDAKGVLTPAKKVSGAADLVIVSSQKRYSGYYSHDNFGSRYLGPWQNSVGFTANSVFTPGDTTVARVTTTTQMRELKFYGLTHAMFIGTHGTRLTIGGSYAGTTPGFILTQFDVVGRSKYAFVDVAYPVTRSRVENFLVHAAFNYLDSSTFIGIDTLYKDRVRYAKLGGQYSLADRFLGVTSVSLDFSQGMEFMGASPNTGLPRGDLSRPFGRADFSKLELNASRIQSIKGNFSAYGALYAQYSFVPLLAAQQFGFGGSDLGRGYSPSEILGDRGLAGKFELRYDVNSKWNWLQQAQPYLFYDIGKVWNIDKLTQLPQMSAASTGAGLRFQFLRYWSGNFFVAKPLTRPVATQVLAGLNGKRPLLFFQISINL